jgi:hypothetical protein
MALKSNSLIRRNAGPDRLRSYRTAVARLATEVLLGSLSACARSDETNFSQRTGFAEYFAANPPSAERSGSKVQRV